jgi:hypothetical protein
MIWIDESCYTMWHSDGRVLVWGMLGERYLPACVARTVKFGGDDITVWGVFFMEWTWPSYNTAWKSKHGRIQGYFDLLRTVYSTRPVW